MVNKADRQRQREREREGKSEEELALMTPACLRLSRDEGE